jgi:hypothetical protein
MMEVPGKPPWKHLEACSHHSEQVRGVGSYADKLDPWTPYGAPSVTRVKLQLTEPLCTGSSGDRFWPTS